MNSKKEFLKKYAVYIFYFSVIFLLIFFIYRNFSVTKEFEKNAEIAKNIKKQKVLEKKEQKDTDGDGLKDWQEVLYRTDPELADSDGDGISDGDEVKNGTDPAKYGEEKGSRVEKITKEVKERSDLEKVFDQQKARQINFDLLKKKKGLSEAEKRKLEKEMERKIALKKTLNTAAERMIEKNYPIDKKKEEYYYGNLFLSFYPDYENRVKEALPEEKLEGLRIEKYKKFTQAEIEDFKVLAHSYINIADELGRVEIEDFDLNMVMESLEDSYRNMGEKTLSLIEKMQKNDLEGATEMIQDYGSAVRINVESRIGIRKFIDVNRINFSDSEAGKIFVYSL